MFMKKLSLAFITLSLGFGLNAIAQNDSALQKKYLLTRGGAAR